MNTLSPTEKPVETHKCRHCGTSFPITDKDLEMLEKLSLKIAGTPLALPAPTICPECRKILLVAWRNETKIYKRKCDATGKHIISHFPPDVPFKVYEEKFWISDGWDAKQYGRDYDFSRPFFDQFADLLANIPRPATASTNRENSDYCNNCGFIKDSYLCFNAQNLERCLYCVDAWFSTDCTDCFCMYGSENCYECILGYDSHSVRHSYDIKTCRNSAFLLSCEGCHDCYGCFGLVNQKHCIFNVQYSPKEYESEVQKHLSLPFATQQDTFEAFYRGKYTKRSLPNTSSEDVFKCSNVVLSKNVTEGRNLQNVEDVRYASVLHDSKLAMDYYTWGHNAEKIYACNQVGNDVHSICLSMSCWDNVSELLYCFLCITGCHDCFGCAGLRNSDSYCILNKQYTQTEYEALVPRIVEHMRQTGEWGELFPAKLSSYGYNEVISQFLQPLTREAALERGFNWCDYEAPFPKVERIIPADKLPDDIAQVPDDILNWAIECEVTKRPFRIVKQELEFYRKHSLPIPRRHPDQRHLDRFGWHTNY